MGGFGSGRPGYRQTAEQCRSIDVNTVQRKGCLKPGWRGGWQWSQDGEQVASINMRAEIDRLHLSYRSCSYGGEWFEVDETVAVIRVPCRFGGSRPYFLCPGVVNGVNCGRRVIKLYAGGRYFLCRHCYRLAYTSQSETECDRALRRANKIRQRLGGDPGMASHFPERPKGMWSKTYERLFDKTRDAEDQANIAMAIQLGLLSGRSGDTRGFWS
jgi:hypothetical protein